MSGKVSTFMQKKNPCDLTRKIHQATILNRSEVFLSNRNELAPVIWYYGLHYVLIIRFLLNFLALNFSFCQFAAFFSATQCV